MWDVNTIMDIIAFNRERASRHIRQPASAWWMAGVLIAAVLAAGTLYAAGSMIPHAVASSSANR